LSKPTFAIIGSGSIGLGWAIVFARAGSKVAVYDIEQSALDRFSDQLARRLDLLAENEMLEENPQEIASRITTTLDLEGAVKNADYVQECGPENIDLKVNIFAQLMKFTAPSTILASSSSAITPSRIAEGLASNERCLVVHPGNPPYLIAIAEVVPAKFTSADATDRCIAILKSVGMVPIQINHEPEGFVFNRLQGAMLREAYCLVRDGVISASDLDLIVTQGLGKRWSIVGPFATSALNVRGGIKSHVERMGASYHRMGLERGQDDPWDEITVSQVHQSIEKVLPDSEWDKNTEKRDLALMKMTKFLQDLDRP
jgi:L-gulonate 3-dehydrogenase